MLIEPFKFANDADGFQLLISKLESFDRSRIIIGLGPTAHYGDNLVHSLVAELYQAFVLNPIKTSQIQKTFARLRTDTVDTYVIAKTLMMQDSLRFASFYKLESYGFKISRSLSPENNKTANPVENPTDSLG